jgi:hypothetical protein
MTEKKLDWNKPIETAEGYPAKVISDDYVHKGFFRRIVQIELPNGNSMSHIYYDDGRLFYVEGRLRNRKTKHEAWQNLYRNYSGTISGTQLYKSEELARKEASGSPDYIATVKVVWEK